MDVNSEIKQMKDEEQGNGTAEAIVWPFSCVSSKRGANVWGFCLLAIGIFWLASSWASALWPLVFIGSGAYLLFQAKKSRA